MPIKALITATVTAALAAGLVLLAPTAAFADVTHDSTLDGNLTQVTVDAEASSAGLQASVVLMRTGVHYSDPAPGDIVYLNEYTLDENGRMTFSARVPDGDLDDYVLAVNVAGGTERYLVSLDPNGPTPVDPPPTDPPATDPPSTDPPSTEPPATDPPATDAPATDPPGTGSSDGSGDGEDTAGSETDGPLAMTGATIATGAVLAGVVLLTAGILVLLARRRRLNTRD